MKKDRVTLNAAEDYSRRCKSIGMERRNTADLQDAMSHPDFKTRHHQLLDELVAEFRQNKSIVERPPFMTVRLGTHPTNEVLRQAILDAGFKIGDWAGDILKRVEVVAKPEDVNIMVVTVSELGFSKGATRTQIYEKALSLGLELCPAEVGPQLRLQYTDQPADEWIRIGMEPITDSDGSLRVFYVVHDGHDRWLSARSGSPDKFWNGYYRWAFRRK